ncbi:PTS sugar transporter subunit IIC [Enterococcus phoeniculicola]|jgi:PTS system cellobiose-specific IIC component|uniref:Permease IIC component n=1 Tax=Enterococcus phoeniculicola ATCC BAA-412 TaxID=1158610 RepID=R3TTY1_9ENTE|nr:PTS transporter subunit EIIC [Enterococcus phoeniculicola]EOL44638.1 PTS system, lactose/cellobiose family IIC component [Enterococcus phoeniculicola ATCC BAA-412]EOT74927.1 PTS system, cellobiose-specific IIC component [Enterococcus phoeniculicola ATCC BAA-412]
MSKVLSWIELKLMPPMAKFAEQRHMKAIRNGVISTLSLIMIGTLFLTIANLPIPGYVDWIKPYTADLAIPFRITMGLLGIYGAFSMGYNLTKSYKLDGITGGILSLATFLMLTIPVNVDELLPEGQGLGWVLPMNYLGGSGMFSAILAMLFASEMYRLFTTHNITIKMPEQVPPAVARSFEALIPGAFILTVVWVVRVILGLDINKMLLDLFAPLVDIMGNNLIGVLLPMFFIHLLWAAGVHGMSIIGSLVRPMWLVMLDGNAAAFADGTPITQLPYIAPEQFYQWTVTIGGAGVSISICILLLFCRSTFLKQVGRFSLIPGIFNINEMLIFGVPIIMNPILAIPFITAPLVTSTISYFAVKFGLVNGFISNQAWTLPAPIGAYLSSGNDWRMIVLVVINVLVAMAIYFPFVRIYDNKMVEEELAASNEKQVVNA